MIRIYFFVIFFSLFTFADNYPHRLHLHVNLAKSYVSSIGTSVVPVSGTQNVLVEIIDVALDQPVWSQTKEMFVQNGDVIAVVEDETLDWPNLLQNKKLVFRITMLDDIVDIPFEFLPFAALSDRSNRARYFNNDNLIFIDYPNSRVQIKQSTSNANFAVNGSIRATYLVGDASELKNVTGPGFNDKHSLNSENGMHKDVVFIDSIGNIGVHNLTPNSRLHIRGNTVFRGDAERSLQSYQSPTGSMLLWDSDRSAFRSGFFKAPFLSSDVGLYSVGFGQDIISKSKYSAVLGGEGHMISESSISSVIIGGQDHSIFDAYSVIVGGFKNLIGGEWSVVLGGREHNIYGDYNVVLGGRNNEVRGESNMIIGQNHVVNSDYSVLIGSNHRVTSNYSMAFGQNIDMNHPYSILYSDGSPTLKSQKTGQMIIQSKNGLGINRAPHSDHMLSVNGNIKTGYFIGDGRHITNIIAGQDYWRQVPGVNNIGIYYMQGPVLVGTLAQKASLTVSGGITVGNSLQASNGTLRYHPINGLEFYHDQWISVDQEDNDTVLSPGQGIALNDRTFSINQLGADINQSLFYNGSRWAAKTSRVWTSYDSNVYHPKRLALFNDTTLTAIKAPLVVQSPPSGTLTNHALVIGLTDSLRLNPSDNVMFLNLDYVSSTNRNLKMIDSSYLPNEVDGYGAAYMIDKQQFLFKSTDKAYKPGHEVQLRTLMNLTPTSMAVHGDDPQLGFDSNGSISFVNTYADHNDQIGIAHKNHLQNKFSNYLFFDRQSHLHFMAGNDTTSQPINFNFGGQNKVILNSDGELIVGGALAFAKLSIFGGGLAFNVNDGAARGAVKQGTSTFLTSISATDPSIQFKKNDQILADFGHLNTAINTSNTELISVLAYASDNPQIDLQSTSKSQVFLENGVGEFLFENDNGLFSLKHKLSTGIEPIIVLDDSDHLSLRTATLSNRAGQEVVINGDIELSNTDKLNFINQNEAYIASIYKTNNHLIFQQRNQEPLRFQTIAGKDLLVISDNQKIAVNSLLVTENAELYVVGDTLFKSPIYYQHNGIERLVQAFVVDKSSTINANNLEIRSVKSLEVDEQSGIGLTVNDQDSITISAPGYYHRLYETKLYDGFDVEPAKSPEYIEAQGKDIVEFKEILPNGGVSINLVDTNNDGNKDSIHLLNTLLNGGLIEGTITVNGNLLIHGVTAEGSQVTNVPYYWHLTANKLYYASGNVGIRTDSPDFPLDVNDIMGSNITNVSTTLDVRTMDFENSTSTNVRNQILFSVDTDNLVDTDKIRFQSESGNLLTLAGDTGFNQNIGIFNDAPTSYVHLKQTGQPAKVLLESESSGLNAFRFFNSDVSKGSAIQLNASVSGPSFSERPLETSIATSRNVIFSTDGTPSLYVGSNYVSIAKERTKSSFYVDGSSTVGKGFAGTLQNTNQGLTVEEKMSVGHKSHVQTGATFFSKDTLRVGDGIVVPGQFRGVAVQNRVGVQITTPKEAFSILGGARIKNKLTMYSPGNVNLFEISPTAIKVNKANQDLVFQISKELVKHVNDKRALSVFSNSVTFGKDSAKLSSNFNLYDVSNDAKLILHDTNTGTDFPYFTFLTNSRSHAAFIGLKDLGSNSELVFKAKGTLTNSYSSNLSNPDMQIQESKVGIGKSPNYTFDVDGTIKASRLYKEEDRMYPVPLGAIMMWAGSQADIPAGWQLCNGTNNSPDLRNKFIKGTDKDGLAASASKTGGKNSDQIEGGEHTHIDGNHTHNIEGGNHTHSLSVHSNSFAKPRTTKISANQSEYGHENGSRAHYQPYDHDHDLGSSHVHGTKDQTNGKLSDAPSHHKQHANTKGTHNHGGGKHSHSWDNQPNYYVLAYIIKVSDT